MRNTNKNAVLEHIHESFRVKEDILPYISTPFHYHSHYELVWIRKGFGIRIVGDHADRFKDGDMVLLGPNLPHVWENDKVYYEGNPDFAVDVFVVHFTDTIIGDLLKFPELTGIKRSLLQSRQGLRVIGETNRKLGGLIERLFISTSIERVILFLRIFQLLEDTDETVLLSSAGFAQFFNEQKSDRLRKIYEYIGKHFTRNLQIDEISDIACMSPTAFCRYFKQNTGYSFVSYLNDFRLAYAKNLLNSKEYKISMIAEMCGFRDISYFNRLFKQKTKMTPTEYIRNLQ